MSNDIGWQSIMKYQEQLRAEQEASLAEHDAYWAAKITQTGDTERDHGDADDVLCDLLETLGFRQTVEKFRQLPKWYA